MALVRRVVDFIHNCFVWENSNEDDTQQIVNDRVPPVDGTNVPDSVVISDVPSSALCLAMNDPYVKMLVELNESLQQTNERLRQTNESLQQTNDRLDAELTAVKSILDKYKSQIESLRLAQIYNQEQLWRRFDVSYSPNYRSESQEEIPQFSE